MRWVEIGRISGRRGGGIFVLCGLAKVVLNEEERKRVSEATREYNNKAYILEYSYKRQNSSNKM